MTNPTSVETVNVVTPGEYLIFDVDGRDYYKISLVQEIDNEDVEMVSVYRTLGFGEATVVNVFDKTRLSGIQAILNTHSENELLSVGDELYINRGGVPWKMHIAGIDLYEAHEVIFVSEVANDTVSFSSTSVSAYVNTPIPAKCLEFYNSINADERQLIKNKIVNGSNSSSGVTSSTEKVWVPTSSEVGLTELNAEAAVNIIFPYFSVTPSNRVKKNSSGSVVNWWLASHGIGSHSNDYCYINGSGAKTWAYQTGSCNVLYCFRLTADV